MKLFSCPDTIKKKSSLVSKTKPRSSHVYKVFDICELDHRQTEDFEASLSRVRNSCPFIAFRPLNSVLELDVFIDFRSFESNSMIKSIVFLVVRSSITLYLYLTSEFSFFIMMISFWPM